MSPARNIDKNKNLTPEEISRRDELSKEFWGPKEAEKVNMKNIFELMYLSFFIPSLEKRKLVEDDLKELESMIEAIADRMTKIRDKSKKEKK